MLRVKSGQAGMALVLTLWLLTLLTILAATYSYAMRTGARLAIHGVELAKSRAIAEAGVWLAVAELLKPAPERRWTTDGIRYQLDFGEGQIHLEIQDEAGKIDLNTAHDTLLLGLLEKAAQPGDDFTYIVNAILDWRDPDQVRRNPGAEDSDYAHAGYDAKDAPFNSVEELRLVAGMTNDIFRRIYPILTVYSGQPGIHSMVAPRDVLLALPGGDADRVDAFLLARNSSIDAVALPPGMDSRYFGGGTGNVFNITSEGSAGGGKLKLDVVIKLNNDVRQPYSVLSWRESKPVYHDTQADDVNYGILPGAG